MRVRFYQIVGLLRFVLFFVYQILRFYYNYKMAI